MPPKLYVIAEEQLKHLENVAKKLFKEDRLSGDAMRDLAQDVDACVQLARMWEYQATEPRGERLRFVVSSVKHWRSRYVPVTTDDQYRLAALDAILSMAETEEDKAS